ncbi:MAG TPA: glycosyltransferase family 9 protein, partial [Chloroflexota bacterium]|nr:glycosyltransferase family 9 protein [Chloroflexota bacterium]
FGDTIFASRFIPHLVAWGFNVVVRAPAPLLRLLERQQGIDRVIDNSQPPPSNVHVQMMMMSLPLNFVIALEEISHYKPPYVSPDPVLVESWQKRLSQPGPPNGKKVGLAWAGRPTPPGRSIPFPLLSGILDTPNIEFHSLQKGPETAESHGCAVTNWDAQIEDFADTAALIANLDLVITIDTAVAHLAGAMNKPVWVMLRYAADWRWFLGRPDSPWYPSMRLFRQRTPGDWAGVVEDVSKALVEVRPGSDSGTIA